MELNTGDGVISVEQEMKDAFLSYSMSVIVSRALPDVRDGLKPVHRRILYAMHGLKNFYNRPYLKSARIVGDVIGKYHPHGDSAVYESLVRMAQDFAMRYPLVDGQGNFGSVDGDAAAAMRYTESRLRELSSQLLADLDKDTVDFAPNYDNKETEPVVLPSKVPQLLINGASGIAVGMATNIPPHNFGEIVEGLLRLIENPDISIVELMESISGPDFPTCGEIHGRKGIYDAYTTGRGSILIRAKTEVEKIPKSQDREQIVVTEIPYQVNKSKLIEKIADLVRDKRVEGISDLRDESAKNEIRIVIELKRGEYADVVLNNLYKLTPLQTSFGVNALALVNGIPKTLDLKSMLQEFYQHRRQVIVRRTGYELRVAEERAHILLGLKRAVENLDEVVALIRGAAEPEQAKVQLIAKFEFSEVQAKSILEMRLSRLTGLEREKILKDYKEVMELIEDLKDILDRPQRVTDIIVTDLKDLAERFADPRRTAIVESESAEFSIESLVADESVAVTVSHAGFVKRTPLTTIAAQRRGGKGRSGMLTKGEDLVSDLFITSNHQNLLCFTNKGRVFCLKVYQIPEAPLRSRGKHFASLVPIESEEKVVSVLTVREFCEGQSIISATKNGIIKKTDLMAYSHVRRNGIIGLKLDENDELISSEVADVGQDVLLATKLGKAIRFSESQVRSMGRVSRGVTGIRFSEEGDSLIGMVVAKDESSILSVCENGYGKRTSLKEYRTQTRGGKGIYTIKVTERNGPVVGIAQVSDQDDLMIMTDSGKMMRFTVSEIGLIGRVTQGVKLMNVESGERVSSMSKIAKVDGEELD